MRAIIQALSCCEAPYAQGARDGIAILYRVGAHCEKGSAEHQNKVRQSLGAQIFSHQATSGIMRGLSLMCESRVCPLPAGLCGGKRGETREEGVAQDLICLHSLIRSVSILAISFWALRETPVRQLRQITLHNS